MITYRIVFKNTENKHHSSKQQRNSHIHSEGGEKPDYRDHIFQRALARIASFLKEGDRVKIKGSPKRGQIIRIRKNIDEINWVSNKPHFIEVQLPDGTVSLAHPSQLKRQGNK